MAQQSGEIKLYDEDYQKYDRRIFGFQMTDIHERINMDRMRRERLERARRHMREAGISVMLLLRNENMRYTTSYAWHAYRNGGAYVLLPLEGDPIVFGHLAQPIHDRRNVTWIKPENNRFYHKVVESKTLFMQPLVWDFFANQMGKQIKEAMKEVGAANEVLTLDLGDSDAIEALERVGIRTAVNREVMVRAQEIKTKDEIECFRACAAICDVVHYELSKHAEPGKTERELSGYMSYIAMKHGSEPTPSCIVMSGQNTWPLYAYVTDKMLREGDIFYADTVGVSFCGYKSCCYRTYSCVTPPSQAAKDAMKKMVEYVDNALADVKPGNTTADIVKHWPHPKFVEGAIHGLGLQCYGPPWAAVTFSLKHPYELKEGHVFAIEPDTVPIGDGQGVRIEDMVVVTNNGCEVLTHASREIITCPRH
jgi:Xaa-Pro aminopeptidase